jgi:enoyl-CoA hydratase
MTTTDNLGTTVVRYEAQDDVARVRLDRPDRLNAVTAELYEGIEAGLERAMADETRVVVLEGEGRAFCVGADLKNHDDGERTSKERREYVWNAQRACEAVQTHPMPVVAKVQGYAIGAGAELALSADFVLMAADAEIRFPEVSIGTYIGGGLTYTLRERVGQARAKELVLSAASLTGTEAAEEGLVTEAVTESELDDAVSELADDIAGNAPIPLQFAKEQFSRVSRGTRQDVLTAEAEALLACMGTDDWEEGIEAFADDREPTFVGE